jgi:putative aldouronate transport system permease protein
LAKKSVRATASDQAFYLINNILLGAVLVVVSYPLIYVVSASFSSTDAVISGRVWLWPVQPSLRGYEAVFQHKGILSGYANSFFYMGVGTAINIVMTILAGYPLSRRDFKARNVIMMAFAFTMIFNGGLIPTYMLVRNLGMVNTRSVMIIPIALSVWNVIITRTFFESTIAPELLEAAKMNGCSDFKFVFYIVLPLSGAIVAVNILFYAVFHWNAFFQAFIYLNDKRLYPLQLVLREILILNEIDSAMFTGVDLEVLAARQGLSELLKYSLIVVASVPVLVMYPFVQRYFVRGVMIGAIKG